jgi:hypothetical protein
LQEIKAGMIDLMNKQMANSKGAENQDLPIRAADVADLFENYGVKVKTRSQLIEEGLGDDLEEGKLFFINKSGVALPVKAFDKQQNIKGVIEAYRDYLVQTSAGQSEIKAWEDITKEFYNKPTLPNSGQ